MAQDPEFRQIKEIFQDEQPVELPIKFDKMGQIKTKFILSDQVPKMRPFNLDHNELLGPTKSFQFQENDYEKQKIQFEERRDA